METMKLRLRVNFQDRGVLSKTQKKNGLKRSWVLLKPQFQTISDVVSYLLHSFDLHHSCPNGIILSMNGFVLPPFESTTIFKDKDRISVKRNGLGLCNSLKATEEARLFVEDAIVEKQTIPSAVRLLANEEFDKETGGYQSEIDEDEDEAEEPVQNAQGGDVVSKKRKASSKIESSKKKRQRQVTPESVQKKDADHREHVKTPQKKRKLANESTHKVAINCTKSSEPTSNTNELEDKKKKTVHASGVPNGERKVCRSTRRKRIQRKWQKVHSAKTNVAEGEKQVPVQNLNKDSGSGKDVVKNIEQLVLEDGDADDDLVPVEIRPGHIRFTPSGKSKDIEDNQEANGWDVQTIQKSSFEDHTTQKHVWDVDKHTPAKETFCWNGITNKRKGQQWGKENQPTSWKESRDYSSHSSSRAARNQPSSSWKGQRDYNTHSSGAWASRKQRPNNTYVDFEKLIPLIDLPKVGDIIAYRLLELSSSWCPQLSSFRVGKISCVHQDSNKIMLVPEPEYPLNLERKAGDDHDDDDDSGEPPQPSVYNEDGSLEIDFPSLVDVRILKRVDSSQSEATGAPASDGTSVPPNMSKKNNITEDGSKNVVPDTGNQELRTPGAPANGKKDVWEEISEALSAKKAQLTQEDSWNKKETSAKRSWSRRTLKSSALGPTMALLRAQNGV